MQISVIVCTYNYGCFLPQALRSLAAQTTPDFELLIVDDGSTDDTEQVVRQFAPRFSNFRFIKKTHTGLADSRNVGIQAATGTHIGFLDADDLWSPDYLSVMRRTFESDAEVEIVYTGGYRVHSSGTILGTFFPPGLPRIHGPIRSARGLFAFFPNATPSAMMFPKTTFERVGPFDVRFPLFGQDWHWLIRAAVGGAYCVRIDHKLVLYRVHGENLTSQTDEMFKAWITIYEDVLKSNGMDRETFTYARAFTRSWGIRILSHYSARQARLVLENAIGVFEEDPVLRIAYASTYLGVAPLAKLARATKWFIRTSMPLKHRVDLSSRPEDLFRVISSF